MSTVREPEPAPDTVAGTGTPSAGGAGGMTGADEGRASSARPRPVSGVEPAGAAGTGELVFGDPLDGESSDDTDRGWGDPLSGAGDDDFTRFLNEKPPHHL
jgi:acetyl-CoA synthetase